MADGDGDGGGDRFDFVLDDEFVAGAAVREPGWQEREAEQAKRQKQARRRGRKERNRHRRRRAVPIVAVVLAFALAGGVGFGLAGQGPLSQLRRTQGATAGSPGASGSPAASTAPANASGTTATTLPGDRSGTTQTTIGLAARSYAVGDCVTWDQTPDGKTRPTEIVACAEPHLMEMVGDLRTSASHDHYPTTDEWHTIIDFECGPKVQAHLAGPIDPNGRFGVSAIKPLPESWARGERQIHCGIQLADAEELDPDAPIRSFTGAVDPRAQQRLHAIGDCLLLGVPTPLPCTAAHHVEVVGNVDLTGRIADVPEEADSDFWTPVLADECRALAAAYLGHAPSADVGFRFYTLAPESWRAGSHLAQCGATVLQDGDESLRVGSLRAGG